MSTICTPDVGTTAHVGTDRLFEAVVPEFRDRGEVQLGQGIQAAAGATNVFGIGLSKTGTTSLVKAFEILGYESLRHFEVERPGESVYPPEQNRTFPEVRCEGNVFYRLMRTVRRVELLDQRYPGSKFLLTTRDTKAWLKSCRHHFRADPKPGSDVARARTELFGTPVFDAQQYVTAYHEHLNFVRDYFRDRPQDVLIMDVSESECWEQLCEFVNTPIPKVAFPKENVSRSPKRLFKKLSRLLTGKRGNSVSAQPEQRTSPQLGAC